MTKVRFITQDEFENMKLYELDDSTYRKIEDAFVKAIGEKVAKKFLEKQLERTLRTLTTQSFVDVLSILTIY